MINHIELMAALTADYLNVFVARPKEDSADIIKLTGYVTRGITDTPQGFSYSGLLSTYANDRVYPGDRDYFLKVLSKDSLLETFADGRDRLEYNYRIVEDGEIHQYAARYSRISKPEEELRLVVAFRNIDSIANIGKEKRTEGLLSAYGAISGIFFSLHRLNVQNNTYIDIKSTPTIDQLAIPGSNDYDANAVRIIGGVSSDWSRDSALRFVERSTLPERMAGKNHISMEFLSYASELCKLHFFREDDDEEGNLCHVIFAVEKVDDEKNLAVINALSTDFQNVFRIDLRDGSSRTIKMDVYRDESTYERYRRGFFYEEYFREYVNHRVHPDDREMLQRELNLENLRKVLKEKNELTGSYRVLVDGEVHHYRYVYKKISELDVVVAGFRNVDDIIAQHNLEEKLQREQELIYQKQREEQLAIVDTLARNFKNVYLVNIENATAKVLKLDDEYTDHRLDDVMEVEFDYEPFLNVWIQEAVYPEDQEMLQHALSIAHLREVFTTQEEYVGNYRMLIKGQAIHYQFNVSLMQDKLHLIAGFQNVDAIIREHSEEERKQREKELAYQNQMKEQLVVFDTLARNFRNVYLVDLEKETAKILKLSNSYKRILNIGNEQEFPFDAVRSYWLNNVVCPEDREEISSAFRTENVKQLLSTQNEFSGNYRSIIDGKIHNFQYSMSRVDMPGVKAVLGYQNIDDIVEKHVAQERKERELEEARLREERERMEVISSLSTIYSTIFSANITTHQYEILNSVSLMGKVAGTYGNFDDVKEDILRSFMAPDMRDSMREFLDLNTLAARLDSVNTISTEYQDPDGKWFQARFIVKKRNECGGATEVLYVARDNTTEKERELAQQEQLFHALEAAQQANRAKSQFLSSMSHDIRTPMNAIIGFTSLAQTHIDDRNGVKDYLSKISTSSSHLLNLINDILDMSRIESGAVKLEEKPVHIPSLIQDFCNIIQGLVDSKHQNLHIDIQNVIHEDVITDRLRLNQVMINIAGNAVKYTQPGGDIFIQLLEKPCSREAYGTYEFSVRDTGAGMSKEFLSHIFETFTREYSSTVSGIQGTGLGMAITKNIVDLMGGTVDVKSEEGKGSLFVVTLDMQLAGEMVNDSSMPEHHDYSGKKVLLVEDNELNREIATAILEDAGMRVDVAADGSEAVDRMYQADEDEFDLIFMDIQMPKMDGYTATREIRTLSNNKKANIPIVAMTANAFEEDRKKSLEAGMNGHIVKPISMEEIAKILDVIFSGGVDGNTLIHMK